jgi:hypothetical protein
MTGNSWFGQRVVGWCIALAAAMAGVARAGAAQQSLVSAWTFSIDPVFESWSLGSPLPQPASSAGGASVRKISQRSVPLRIRGSIGDRWSVDLATAWASGEVEAITSGSTPQDITLSLSGLADVRLRATGHVVRDRLLFTFGANIPTGRTKLDAEELAAVRVLGAHALGLATPLLGLGGGASAGLVLARPVSDGRWAIAAGLSYEYRAKFSPIALAGGVAIPDFSPSDVIHVSLGADGLVGAHAMTFNLGVDVFSEDRLALPQSAGSTASSLDTRLGPIYSADWEMRLATTRLREAVLFVSERYRTRFTRDGSAVDGSDGHYVDAGARVGLPTGARGTVSLGLSGRLQTGLDFEAALATAAARLIVFDARFAQAANSGVSLSPWVRVQTGTIESGSVRSSATGFAVGLSLGVSR